MKIKLLFTGLLLSTFLGISTISAQITLELDTMITQVIESDDIVAHNSFTNILPQQKTIKWVRSIIDITDGWTIAICDNNSCYIPSVSEEEIDLGPSATSVLDVHLYPNGIYEGYALLEVNLSHANDPNTNVTAVFVYDSELSTSTDNLSSFTFKVYPNPSTGLFTIENQDDVISSVRVNAMSGPQLLHLNMGQRQFMDLGKLPAGMYMMQMLDKKGLVLETKLVSKL